MSAELFTPGADELAPLLVGKRIVRADVRDRWDSGPVGELETDDGTVLEVWGNDGGCSCSAGCYPLAHLGCAEGVITSVEVEERPDGDDVKCPGCGKSWSCECSEQEERGFYRVFVVTESEGRSLLASFEGDDGNGYYGTGWHLRVKA